MKNEENIVFRPIGIIRSSFVEKYDAPHQPQHHQAVIELHPHCNYEQALTDLEGFERIWVIWVFDKVEDWKPKVHSPRDNRKHGVFATRSPHRPNPIAMSVAEVVSIQKLSLTIRGADMLDGSPVLDIKPYIPQHDSFPTSRAGWVDEVNTRPTMTIHWSERAQAQADWIEEHSELPLRNTINMRLIQNHTPSSFNRIEHQQDNFYSIAYKAWRVVFAVEGNSITIAEIRTAYCLAEPALQLEQIFAADQVHGQFCRLWGK